MSEMAPDWIFVIDLLNFSFWPSGPVSFVTLNSTAYQGYWTLCACIKRAIDAGIPICDPNYYSRLTLKELEQLFITDNGSTLSMLPIRHELLQRAGRLLIQKYKGSFLNFILECNQSAQTLIAKLVNEFEDIFDDACLYKSKRVHFYKRAQILVADLWACTKGTVWGEFKDLDTVTIFADYRIPQILVYHGILEYSDELMRILETHAAYHSRADIDSNTTESLMAYGDPLEVEIRGCSIWALECVRQRLEKLGNPMNSILLDFYLWDFTSENREKLSVVPFHRTRSIYY
jgi:hypothetical protein